MDVPAKWSKIEYHEFATEIYPSMNEAEFEELCSEMTENGYDKKQPIIIYDGKILDGVHRHKAAVKTGKVPTFDEYKGNDPLTLVKNRNALRRHMNPSQRAMAAAAFCTFRNGGDRKGNQFANLQTDPTQEDSARDHNVSPRSVADAHKVLTEGTEALVGAVRNGTLAVSDAAKIVDEPAKTQDAAVAAVESGTANTATGAVRKKRGKKGGGGSKKPADPKKKSKDMHDCIGKLVRYADDLASGKPKFTAMRDDVHRHMQAAKTALTALEKATK